MSCRAMYCDLTHRSYGAVSQLILREDHWVQGGQHEDQVDTPVLGR
jgi:hypothetical protein